MLGKWIVRIAPIGVLSLFCNPLNHSSPQVDTPHPGMVKIQSAGKSFQQGWNDTLASLDEKPGMRSSFTYDYWLDSTEITQGEYFAITGRRPVSDSAKFGVGDEYPVYYVSWFDAALYCNARSKAEKLDTVYVYFGVKAQPNGSVYELTGIRCDLSRDGYRLPTESEWEFAARGGTSALPYSKVSDSTSAQANSWYVVNSGGKSHPVATKAPNAFGLYDMAGNVFGWTNDWKGPYNGKTIINSIGATNPNGDYEKVIKGGAFNYGFMNLRPSYRSATYATTLSSANEYVGFRCARGRISGYQYIRADTGVYSSNPVSIVADRNLINSFVGTSIGKIVFVNVSTGGRTLCVIDLSKTFPYVQEYLDDKNVYVPTLSPDGRFVAYCSRNEGLSGPSKVTIRFIDSLGSPKTLLTADSAYVPRWWINRSTGDTCIVYTNSAIANSSSLWNSTKTYLQKISAGKPVGGPVELITNGGYHDGLSVDKGYAVTGFDRLMVRNLNTGEEKQEFLSPDNGKDPNGSTQVCNVSISPDTGSNPRCLFLDFGYAGTSTVTGGSYGIHKYLFVSTMAGSVTMSIPCPSGEKSWDYPEWSNSPNFAIATGRNTMDQSHAIYFVNMENGDRLQAISGIELENPFLWTGISFCEDSLGRYDLPYLGIYQPEIAFKMHLFWKMCDQLEAVFLGTSLVYCGIDCSKITRLTTLNLGYTGCGIYATTQLVQNYILNHSPKIKLIGINIPFNLFSTQTGDAVRWELVPGTSNGFLYDQNHGFWKGNNSSYLLDSIRKSPYPNLFPSGWDSLGHLHTSCDGWGGPNPGIDGPVGWTTSDPNYLRNLSMFSAFIDTLSAHRIHLLAVNFPENPAYKNTIAYSRGGPTWDVAHQVMDTLRKLEAQKPYFHIYDAYLDGNHDYTDQDAHNTNHLCSVGAEKLSVRVDSVIRNILNK
jgi:uncharacterized protein (TIGR02171 family)